jgi:hypothetical protein
MANGTIGVSQIDVLTTSGTGTLSIVPPATNTNRTLTLPDGTGTIVANGVNGSLVSGTAVASTSGTSIDFTGIPSWVKRITVMFSEVSLSSTADILIRLGNAGGIEDTGYISTSATASANSSSTTGFVIRVAAAANVLSGIAIIQNVTGNSWVCSHSTKVATTATPCGGGSKTLSDTLTQIRITTTSTDTFDAGTVNIMYE